MPNPHPFLLAFFFCLTVAAAAPAGGPFLDLTVDEALARAKAEEKLVFIDFFATWCGPCKQLDSTTFADEKVVEWLGKHTLPLKVDVDEQQDLAKQFKVRSMPTLVFLKDDGAELHRIMGYQTSDQFLRAAGEVAANPEKDAVTRAREELETGYWPEAIARQKLANALSSGKPTEADLEYAEKAVELDKGAHPDYAETRDRLREQLEQAGEAADQG